MAAMFYVNKSGIKTEVWLTEQPRRLKEDPLRLREALRNEKEICQLLS
jgi:hypothetical protein